MVEFLDDENHWSRTFLVPTHHNYKNWKPLLKEGNVLGNLKLKGSDMVDADSKVVKCMDDTAKESRPTNATKQGPRGTLPSLWDAK